MSNIVIIWDSMIDKYIYGNTDKKNPESPMPLLKVEKEEIRLWWASNVANNIAQLNWGVTLISMVWDDINWSLFSTLCEWQNINLKKILMESPTITKTRFLDSQYKQQLLRVDEEIHEKISTDWINQVKTILKEEKPDYILISDYDKWIITKDLVSMVKDYAKDNLVKILVDIKPQNLEFFHNVYLVKPNFKEFCEMMGIQWMENTDENVAKYGKEFTQKYKTNIVITRWWKWSTLITKDWNVHHIPSEERKVFDVTWAWDTYIATLTYALGKWMDITDAVKLANKASWIVVWKVWTASITKEELGIE